MSQTLSDIKSLLTAHGLSPKKRFGQNFLHDHNQMRRIMDAANITPGDRVLEVGPGTGALTEWLADAGARVLAVEVDADLEPILASRLGDRIDLIIGSALAGKHELAPEVLAALGDEPFKLIANLPYNVASPLLANLATAVPTMTTAVVMIQKEVADRFVALPGTKEYGPLGIIIQAMCHVERVGTLSPGCFWPKPTIASAVVQLTRRDQPLTDDPARLSATCQALFQKRRKQLGSILGRDTTLPPGISHGTRPDALPIEALVALSRIWHD